jgi:hypothetical protein
MSVRIGKIELTGVQDLHTEEARTLVEQRVPEQQGSVFQDLGREPVTILIDGLLFGEESLSALETLRQAHAKAEPQSFAADLVVGTDLTEVIIEDFGFARWPATGTATASACACANTSSRPRPATRPWPTSMPAWPPMARRGAMPASPPPACCRIRPRCRGPRRQPGPARQPRHGRPRRRRGQQPRQPRHRPAQRHARHPRRGRPHQGRRLFDALGKAGALGGMLAKYAQEGAAFLKQLDPSKLSSLMKAFSGGLDFLNQLKAVADAAPAWPAIKDLKLPPELDRIIKGGPK